MQIKLYLLWNSKIRLTNNMLIWASVNWCDSFVIDFSSRRLRFGSVKTDGEKTQVQMCMLQHTHFSDFWICTICTYFGISVSSAPLNISVYFLLTTHQLFSVMHHRSIDNKDWVITLQVLSYVFRMCVYVFISSS